MSLLRACFALVLGLAVGAVSTPEVVAQKRPTPQFKRAAAKTGKPSRAIKLRQPVIKRGQVRAKAKATAKAAAGSKGPIQKLRRVLGRGLRAGSTTAVAGGKKSRMQRLLGKLRGSRGATPGKKNPPLVITPKSLRAVLKKHGSNTRKSGNSTFHRGVDVVRLVHGARFAKATPGKDGHVVRTYDARRVIGLEKRHGQASAKPTRLVTVVTDRAGQVKTAYPGRPRAR
ncbi:MAG: hypothetical protein NXI31_26445 [bacterium]|nr:hypothetical protein [bacterium]